MRTSTLYRLALSVSLGGFLFGFDASVISGVISFITSQYNLTDWEIGLVVAAPTIGAIIAASLCGPISDRIGRKPMLIVIAGLYTISAAVSAFTPNFEVLCIARFIGGLGFGSLTLAPIYLTEISPAPKRGRIVSFNQLNIVIGFSAAYFINYLFIEYGMRESSILWGGSENIWRWMLGVELIPAAIFFITLCRIPESPRWLSLNGQEEQAQNLYQSLYADYPDEPIPHHGDEEILPPVKKRIVDLFGPNTRFIFLMGCVLAISQQITGINAIYFYAPTIFEQSGVGTNAAFSQAALIGIINLLCTVFAIWAIDRIGRKPLLIIGLSGIFVSMVICSYQFNQASYKLDEKSIAVLSSQMDTQKLELLVNKVYDNDVAFKREILDTLGRPDAKKHEAIIIQEAIDINPIAFLVGILIFVASFAMSLGPVMWVMLPEIFPNHLRGVAIAFTGAINSLVSFGVQIVFPWELTHIGAAITFIIYGILALLSLAFVIRFLPETKGKSLEEITKSFNR